MNNSFNISGSNITNLAGSGDIHYQEVSNPNLTDSPSPDQSAESQTQRSTILILAANPKGTSQLRLGEEVREIEAGLQRNGQNDRLLLEQKWAVRPRDVRRALSDCKPQFVHFCGHGAGAEGLALENEIGEVTLVSAEALADLFELFADQITCVLLNACYSETQATAIAQHIPYVIGMNQAIGDKAAIEFSVGFYDAIVAGESVERAYKFGCAAIRMAGIEEFLTPVLLTK